MTRRQGSGSGSESATAAPEGGCSGGSGSDSIDAATEHPRSHGCTGPKPGLQHLSGHSLHHLFLLVADVEADLRCGHPRGLWLQHSARQLLQQSQILRSLAHDIRTRQHVGHHASIVGLQSAVRRGRHGRSETVDHLA